MADDAKPPAPAPAPKELAGRGLASLAKQTWVGLGRLGAGVEHGLEDVGHGLEGVGRGASEALTAPDAAELAPLLPAADLPALADGAPLEALAVRLDREADLFRNVALRELARAATAGAST